MGDSKELTDLAIDSVMSEGACAAGITATDTLLGGPPSTDLTYVLPGARSAVTFAVPLDPGAIERYLGKKDHAGHQRDNIRTNLYVTGLAVGLATYLDQRGYPSFAVAANTVYRKDTPAGIADFKPDISHRYLAVRSGVGWFGLSGNVITKTHGAAVILGTVVTTAELEPTEPLPPGEKYCDDCRLCMASCLSGMMHPRERTTVTMGGYQFSYSKRRTYRRCDLVCGGFTGLARNGKWSTWSPGRFPIPKREGEFGPALVKAVVKSWGRPVIEGGTYHPAMPGNRKLNLTCGNCQLVCHPDKEERKRRHRLLTKSGVVIQHRDGSLEAVSPEAAASYLAALGPEQRACYEEPPSVSDDLPRI